MSLDVDDNGIPMFSAVSQSGMSLFQRLEKRFRPPMPGSPSELKYNVFPSALSTGYTSFPGVLICGPRRMGGPQKTPFPATVSFFWTMYISQPVSEWLSRAAKTRRSCEGLKNKGCETGPS